MKFVPGYKIHTNTSLYCSEYNLFIVTVKRFEISLLIYELEYAFKIKKDIIHF